DRVWVLFTDSAGNYQRKEDGSPQFHNIHPLAYGLGSALPRLPGVLRETYRVYTPPGVPAQPWHVRIAVARGEQFLTNRAGETPWVELGELSWPQIRKVPALRASLERCGGHGRPGRSGAPER